MQTPPAELEELGKEPVLERTPPSIIEEQQPPAAPAADEPSADAGPGSGSPYITPDPRDQGIGALPGEGPLRIDLYNVPGNTPSKVKLLRLLWALVQFPFWRGTPPQLSPLRIALLKLFGAEIGPACLIGSGVKIWLPWNLVMGERSTIGADTEIQNFVPVIIGRHVVISQRNYICASTHDHTDPHFPTISTPITIGSQSWVASECVLGPGAEIGEGAVISVRSVVSKPMPPWMICAGSPCRPITERVITQKDNAKKDRN